MPRSDRSPNSPQIALPAPIISELELLEWRISRLENAAIIRIFRWVGNRALRWYRRLGHFLLKTPFSSLLHSFMGRNTPEADYRRWIAQQSTDSPSHQSPPGSAPETGSPTRISVLTPVFRPKLEWLKEAVESVLGQTHQNWELLLVLDGPPEENILDGIRRLAAADRRIRLISGEKGGISATLNHGLSECTGAYVTFLDQDDFLAHGALAEVAAAIQALQPDLIYSDEDYVSESGIPCLPIFKPGWSPALLLTCMYMGHMLVADTRKLRGIGGFRTAHDGAQDFDVALRLTDSQPLVVHIPRVLYHWRRHENSTAQSHSSKPYSHAAGQTAVADTLTRRGLQATAVDGPLPNTYRLVMTPRPASASVIVPTRNAQLLRRLFSSIRQRNCAIQANLNVLLHADGGNKDADIRSVAAEYHSRIVEFSGPFNFSRMNNLCAAGLDDSILVFLNDDVVVQDDAWLDKLCDPFARDEVGVVGARLNYADGTIQHAGILLDLSSSSGHPGRFQLGSPFWPWLSATRNVSAVTGACLAIRRQLFEQLGGFDVNFPNNFSDVDLCLQAQAAGFEVVLNCDVNLCHDEAQTRTAGTLLRERVAFWHKWGSVLVNSDFYYSPNLARQLETIQLSSEPTA
ncbi:MAG: glycosyltransferase [Acidobacteria bacterium]|nr:glycosyltransferase [Acidobacteriota bacterium]